MHLENKTIEWRNLWSQASSFLQCKLEISFEILTPKQSRLTPSKTLEEPQPENWKLRRIVWNTKDVGLKNSKSESPLKKHTEIEAHIFDETIPQKE